MRVIRYILNHHALSAFYALLCAGLAACAAVAGSTLEGALYVGLACIFALIVHHDTSKGLRARAQLAELLEAAEFDVAQALFTMHLSAFTRPEVKDLQLLLTCAALSPTAVKGNSALATAIAALRGEKP